MSISDNQVVSIHYELRNVDNGEILDSNINAAPLSFIVGKGQIIPGLEEKIKELKAGENADIKVAAADAYGIMMTMLFKHYQKSNLLDLSFKLA